MDLKRLLKFLRLIESIDLEYMITGSIASILYGKPRLTQDMDVVVVLPKQAIGEFAQLFNIEEYYCPPVEAIEEAVELGDKGHLNIIDQSTGFKVDVYPAGQDPLIQWGFQNKKKIELIEGEEVWVAPPEYVILKKLAYYKEGGSQKHLDDVNGMLNVSNALIKTPEIQKWCSELDLSDAWEECLRLEKAGY